MTVAIPPTLSYEHAAALPLAGISAMVGIVQTAKLSAGMRVLIHAAAGGVGSIAVQLALMREATVIATCSEHNLDFVRDLGAREVIAYDKTAFEEQVRDVDVVLDLIGGDVHRRSYRVLRPGGMMVCLAALPYQNQGAQFEIKIIAPTFQRIELRLHQSSSWPLPERSGRASSRCCRCRISPRRRICRKPGMPAARRYWYFKRAWKSGGVGMESRR